MWSPKKTAETRPDLPDKTPGKKSLFRLWVEFGVLALTMGLAGWILEHAAANISLQTGLGDEVVGTLFTSVSTSLPELITTIAAVRRGALTLAVGGIIGGNSFDTLFAAFSDVAFRGGSIYHHMGDRLLFWLALSILMTGVLMMGLIRREERGIGRMGLESFIILCLYAGGVILLLFG